MKAITIKQPWASLIVEGIKDIENRTWQTKYRGRVLIHAGAIYDNSSEIFINDEHLKLMQNAFFDFKNIGKGAIIGSIEIVDCVINHTSIWAEKCPGYHNGFYVGTTEKHIYNWVLANPVKFDEPIFNVKGKLSFWEYKL